MIYLDAAAHEMPLPAAVDAFLKAQDLANPSSLHSEGRAAKSALEAARATVARCLNCEPSEVCFTSGATESCNWMIHCLDVFSNGVSEIPHYEHHAILEYPAIGPVAFSNLDPGHIHMLANNETGEIYDIESMKKPLKGLFGCDATAAVGQIPVDFRALGVDYLAFGAHKFGGLSGIGALIVREGAPVSPMICGGGQERGMRGGTESVALACAMAAALEKRVETMYDDIARITKLRDEFITEILRLVPDAYINGPWVICDASRRLPNNANISFLGVESQSLVLALSRKGLCASSGSACTSGSLEGSYVLRAMGLSEERARSAVRFSLPYRITQGELKQAVEIVVSTVSELRALSPACP
jgi:cysteine desulfurase